jgi:hypothetical protein
MVNADMFKDAFVLPKKIAPAQKQPQLIQPSYEDPEIAKLKFFFLKWLSLIIGGAAILLIVWRIILKFV